MKNERDFYRDSEAVTRSAESGTAVGKDGKKRIRLIIRIAVPVTVGSLLRRSEPCPPLKHSPRTEQ